MGHDQDCRICFWPIKKNNKYIYSNVIEWLHHKTTLSTFCWIRLSIIHINKNNRTNIDIDETKCNDWGFIFMKISSLKWLLPLFDMADTFNKRSTTILVNHTLSIEYQQFNFMFNPHNNTWTSQLQYCLRHWTMKIKCY